LPSSEVSVPTMTCIAGKSFGEIFPIRMSSKVCSTLLPQPEKLEQLDYYYSYTGERKCSMWNTTYGFFCYFNISPRR
jgi:hypothetical protein